MPNCHRGWERGVFGRSTASVDREFTERGYVVLPGFVPDAVVDQIVREADEFYERQGVESSRADRTMNFHQESPTVRRVLHGKELRKRLRPLLSGEPFFLQSIYFNAG